MSDPKSVPIDQVMTGGRSQPESEADPNNPSAQPGSEEPPLAPGAEPEVLPAGGEGATGDQGASADEPQPDAPSRFRTHANSLGRVWGDDERVMLNGAIEVYEHLDEGLASIEKHQKGHHITKAREHLHHAWDALLQHVIAHSATPQA